MTGGGFVDQMSGKHIFSKFISHNNLYFGDETRNVSLLIIINKYDLVGTTTLVLIERNGVEFLA